MEKNQIRAIYGIAVEKSNCSSYVVQQKLLKRLRSQIDVVKETYGVRWQEAWGNMEDRVLSMEEDELRQSWEICQEKGILEFKQEMQNVVNRNRYSSYSVYKK